jgi:hypothetical protein
MKEASLMPHISLVPVEMMEGQVKEGAQMLQAALGVVPHSFRTYAHRPEIALAFAHLAQTVLGTGTREPRMCRACKRKRSRACSWSSNQKR